MKRIIVILLTCTLIFHVLRVNYEVNVQRQDIESINRVLAHLQAMQTAEGRAAFEALKRDAVSGLKIMAQTDPTKPNSNSAGIHEQAASEPMIIAVTDIFQLAPDFENAVVNVHNTTMPIALVVCFAGLTMAAVRAQHERCLQSIWPELMRILLVSMFLVNMDQVGSWVNGLVTDIEQAANVNGNPLAAFVAAIQQKFGVDLSALASTVSPGGTLGTSGSSSSGAITVST
jgi:hypothetical protein